MLYGIISDIHSNLEALLVVSKELKRRQIRHIICLGDIVGYGANPNECCEVIDELTDFVILGNHDAGSIGLTDLSYFNEGAKSACIWTSKVLTQKNREWLKSLPITLKNEGDLIVHSAPSNPKAWNYILSEEDAVYEFSTFEENICFVGHSHVPITFVKEDSQYRTIQDYRFKLVPSYRYIINPGGVGQPRDDDPRASFAIYDKDKNEIEIIKVPYDIKSAQQKIIAAGLPKWLAVRLALGR
ncbi:MAG: metallophosphoesterase family protein [bacterium]|nr:metallophosphoesterase family protein [bacterium]